VRIFLTWAGYHTPCLLPNPCVSRNVPVFIYVSVCVCDEGIQRVSQPASKNNTVSNACEQLVARVIKRGLRTALGLDHVLLLGLEAPLELSQLARELLQCLLHDFDLVLHSLDDLRRLGHLCDARGSEICSHMSTSWPRQDKGALKKGSLW